MSADLLRQAAAKLRETAKGTAGPPWTCSPVWSPDSRSTSGVYSYAHPTGTVESEVVASGRIRSGYGGIRNPHNALWIALMHPGVAEPLAAWFDFAAEHWRPEALTMKYPVRHDLQHRTLEIARAILGEVADA